MREKLYILVRERTHEPVVICKVIVTEYADEIVFFKIIDVILDNSGNGIYRYWHKTGQEVTGSKQYIYDIK